MGIKLKINYYDLTEMMDILYANFHINCYSLFNAIDVEKPLVLVAIAMDTPPEYNPIVIETKNIDESNKYLVDVAKRLFDYITMNEDKIENEEENEVEIDIDPEIISKIESIEVYNISEYDYALLFIFNLR